MKKLIILLLLLVAPAVAGVSDGATIRQSFACNGSTTTFTFDFECNSSDDVLVYDHIIATGDEGDPLTEDTDYTIAPTGSDYLNGGVVTISPALESTSRVVIVRRIKQSQELSSGAVTHITTVAALDKLTRQVQDMEDRKDRSWHRQESDGDFDMEIPGLATIAETYPYFGATGVLTYVASAVPSSTPVSPFMETLLDDTSASAGLATLLGTPVYNVMNTAYGAVGDGVTDDSAAVQAAADAAAAAVAGTAANGVVFIPAGTYLFNTAISVPRQVSIIGSGSASTFVTPVGCHGFDFQANYVEWVYIQGMTITGTGYWTTVRSETDLTTVAVPSVYAGINIGDDGATFGHSIRIKDVDIELFQYGIRLLKSYAISIKESYLHSNKSGLYIDSAASANSVISCYKVWSEYNGFNYWMSETVSSYFSMCVNQASRNHAGIFMDSCKTITFDNLYNEFFVTPDNLTSIDHPSDEPAANTIYDSDTSTGSRQFIHMTNCSRCEFTNMRMQRHRIGIYMRLSSRCLIDTILEVDRNDLTLGGVSYNATIINYAGSTVESNSANNRYFEVAEPIISRHLTIPGRRGGMTWYKDTQQVYEKNNSRTRINETGWWRETNTDGLTSWKSNNPIVCYEGKVVTYENKIVTYTE